jgi:hypothetical protein
MQPTTIEQVIRGRPINKIGPNVTPSVDVKMEGSQAAIRGAHASRRCLRWRRTRAGAESVRRSTRNAWRTAVASASHAMDGAEGSRTGTIPAASVSVTRDACIWLVRAHAAQRRAASSAQRSASGSSWHTRPNAGQPHQRSAAQSVNDDGGARTNGPMPAGTRRKKTSLP